MAVQRASKNSEFHNENAIGWIKIDEKDRASSKDTQKSVYTP